MWCVRLKTSLQLPNHLKFMASVLKGMGQESERGRGGGVMIFAPSCRTQFQILVLSMVLIR